MKNKTDDKENMRNEEILDSAEQIRKKRKLQNKVLQKIVEHLNSEGENKSEKVK